ncbi:MAG: 5'-nucleotidase C-terminal domain-containing protein, partial [Candidatus Hydrothermae bacterium]|nr:5'-nucleotidase C-terminal domain-containing protein [Candidatus Hydrothermae bacterium]
HHHLYPSDLAAGYARFAFIVDSLLTLSPDHLLLHAGDISVGDLAFSHDSIPGRAEFALMQHLGFDDVVLGNHELDLGEDHLEALLSAVGWPDTTTTLLTANMQFGTHPLSNRYVPWDTFRVQGHLIGIFGLTTEMPTNILPETGDSIVATDPVQAAQGVAQTLQSLGVERILLLSHLGVDQDTALAAQVAGIDLIIGGHSHTRLDQALPVQQPTGDTTYVVQAGSWLRWVGLTQVDLSGTGPFLQAYTLIPVDSGPVDPTVQTFLDSLQGVIQGVYGVNPYTDVLTTVLDTFGTDLTPWAGVQDVALGNLVADALQDTLQVLGTQASLIPMMLLSDPLLPGPATRAELFRASPYGYDPTSHLDSRLAVVTLRGDSLRVVLRLAIVMGYPDMLAQVSGMRYVFTRPANPFLTTLDSLWIQNVPVPPGDTTLYTVGMDLWTLYGITRLMGVPVHTVDTLPLTVAEALYRYAALHPTLQPVVEGRVRRRVTVVNEPPMQHRSFPVALRIRPGLLRILSPEGSTYRISLFRPDGRQMARALLQRSVQWHLPSGIYLLRIETPEHTQSARVWIP